MNFMKSNHWPILVVLSLFGLAILQYELAFSEIPSTYEIALKAENLIQYAMGQWRIQRHILISVMAVFALLTFCSKHPGSKVLLFILQVIGFGIVVFSDTFTDFSVLSIFLALSIESHAISQRQMATSASIGLILVLIFFPRTTSSWYVVSLPFSLGKNIGLALYASLSTVLFHFIHTLEEALEREKSLNNYLKRSVVELSTANVGFQDYAHRVKEVASREERNRIIREVHDSTGYTLTNITMMMEAGKSLVYSNPAKLLDILKTTKEISLSSLQQIRKTLRILGKEHESLENPMQILHRIFTTFEQATNVKVSVEYRNISLAPKEMIDARLFRIIQESLTNAFWHGEATKVSVQFWFEQGLTVIIADNGKGAASISEGIGLKSMKEQLQEIGGTVNIQTIKGAGFQLTLHIPSPEGNNG